MADKFKIQGDALSSLVKLMDDKVPYGATLELWNCSDGSIGVKVSPETSSYTIDFNGECTQEFSDKEDKPYVNKSYYGFDVGDIVYHGVGDSVRTYRVCERPTDPTVYGFLSQYVPVVSVTTGKNNGILPDNLRKRP